MTYKIIISLWYNHGRANELAIKRAPELGKNPHAQAVMEYYGISYQDAVPQTISDSWIFKGCDKYPKEVPYWMSVYDEASGEKLA